MAPQVATPTPIEQWIIDRLGELVDAVGHLTETGMHECDQCRINYEALVQIHEQMTPPAEEEGVIP